MLFAPVSGPWGELAATIDFARDVGAGRTLAIHELVASDLGLEMIDARMSGFLHDRGLDYVRVEAGEDMPLD